MLAWKNPLLLLSGVGISFLGNWIYLIAINLLILDLTGSPAAVAGLYVLKPIAVLLMNVWSGSVVDRVNERKLMVMVDILRGALVFCIPLLSSLWGIYGLILIIHMIGAFFGPASSVYITKLVPQTKRKRFNSFLGMTNSGAFLIGPGLAGVLIMMVGTELCIIINGITFLICAFLIFLLPDDLDQTGKVREPMSWKGIRKDWQALRTFAEKAPFFITVYLLFQGAMMVGFALDSQEVTYIKQHLQLSDQKYGLIVSITAVGSLAGGSVAAILANKLSTRMYLSGGILLSSVGYVFFYSSYNMLTATVAFIFLGFFMAFANTGYTTYFQNTVPVNLMGRFGSVANMVQGVIQILLTTLLGLFAQWFTLQVVCLILAGAGAILALFLLFKVFIPSERNDFSQQNVSF
ncbi:MFS transporter [Pontibacillus sp. HN14]|uniref:MFS transporter n=1 Tax=Pontibacillus chungwhensis TaxID=265426 RepID=A0ABY8V377_9BACI|nr:MFS transporter [Pontibacillus chungwhensis]MCD5323298.1 MFS transporter [Pontibacillus sp. HN14]WIG00205.1 MFS transporter [Pontibacillus chungwhensis]